MILALTAYSAVNFFPVNITSLNTSASSFYFKVAAKLNINILFLKNTVQQLKILNGTLLAKAFLIQLHSYLIIFKSILISQFLIKIVITHIFFSFFHNSVIMSQRK